MYELPDLDFSKAAERVFDKMDNGMAGLLPSSNLFDLVETLGKGFHGNQLAGQLQKVDPNESGSLYRFPFVRWYVDLGEGPNGSKLEEEVSLEYAEESKWAEQYKKMSRPFMKLEGIGIVCPYPRLDLDPLWRQWELPIVNSHTEGQ